MESTRRRGGHGPPRRGVDLTSRGSWTALAWSRPDVAGSWTAPARRRPDAVVLATPLAGHRGRCGVASGARCSASRDDMDRSGGARLRPRVTSRSLQGGRERPRLAWTARGEPARVRSTRPRGGHLPPRRVLGSAREGSRPPWPRLGSAPGRSPPPWCGLDMASRSSSAARCRTRRPGYCAGGARCFPARLFCGDCYLRLPVPGEAVLARPGAR